MPDLLPTEAVSRYNTLAMLEDSVDGNATLVVIDGVLRERLGIDYATVQIERGGWRLWTGPRRPPHLNRLSHANHAR